MLDEQFEHFSAFYRDLDERLSQLIWEADCSWDGYSDPPPVPLDSLLELLATPAPAARDEYEAITVDDFVSQIVESGYLLPCEQACQLAKALVDYTKQLPAEATGGMGSFHKICDLIKELPPAEQAHLVREMCESKGGWHLQSLASWLAKGPGFSNVWQTGGKTTAELNQHFLSLLRSMPLVRKSLEAAAAPTADQDVRCFAPDALKRLDEDRGRHEQVRRP
jgi:hypothetical protein